MPRLVGAPPTRDIAGHAAYEVTAGSPVELDVDGPTLLHVWAHATRGEAAESPELRILEGDRERAATSVTVPRAALLADDPPALAGSQLVHLPRAVVHVPPGRHAYRLVSHGADAVYAAPLTATPVVHLGDALSNAKSEAAQLATARLTCRDADTPSLCAFALALLAQDREPDAESAPGSLSWNAAMAAASPLARDVAEGLARGGPRDPMLKLQADASGGAPAALSRLGSMILESIDDGTREGWAEAMTRGTRWAVAASEHGAQTWTALAGEEHPTAPTCGAGPLAVWPEIGRDEREIPSSPWHDVPVIDLLATMPCDATKPVELVVDGQVLRASPSAPIKGWHVRVNAGKARVRRTDDGPGHVYAIPQEMAACGERWEVLRAPALASTAPRLTFDHGSYAPGIEIWLREGAPVGHLRVDPASDLRAPVSGLRIVARAGEGPFAYDEHGVRWVRAARVALPAWASDGVQVRGDALTAVRAIVRTPRGAEPAPSPSLRPASSPLTAEPLDESILVALSRQILSTPPPGRGALHLRRALLLASGGAEAGATEDAHAARALGTRGPSGEDPVDLVRASIRRRPFHVAPLPSPLSAYGIESDFDPEARRCTPGGAGDRAAMQQALDETPDALETDKSYDPALAARVLAAVQRAPLDPRGAPLESKVLTGSRWKLLGQLAGGRPISRERERHPEMPVDGGGELRPRVITGEPFDRGSYATIVPDRPARALLEPSSKAEARLDVSCVARAPAEARPNGCPLEVTIGDAAPIRPKVRSDGSASIPLPRARSRSISVRITLPPGPGRWVALARIAFERQVPNTTKNAGGARAPTIKGPGWVLDPPHVESRYQLEKGETLSVDLPSAALVRVDALAAGGDADEVVAVVGDRVRSLPVDGTQIVLPVTKGGRLFLRATRGSASIALAKRVESDDAPDDGEGAPHTKPEAHAPRASVNVPGPPLIAAPNVGTDGSMVPWQDRTERSPEPLTPLQAALGTSVVTSGATYGTIRAGSPSSSSPDGYASQGLEYRRRIESIGLWTDVAAFGRVRSGGEPSYGGDVVLYEDMDDLHVRLSGSLGMAAQRIEGQSVQTWNPHAFAEYSWRVTRDFFVLPRVGYDGVYTNPRQHPASLSLVDDAVYNAYRVKWPTFAFAQALLWFAPHFNDIFYLRNRLSMDPLTGDVSHVAVRPGCFLAFGDLNVSGYLDNTWYAPARSAGNRSWLDEQASLSVVYNAWSRMGSFALQLGAQGLARPSDGGWQASVFATVLGSYRRGLRDFSSLELDFPEQLSGGIPWRGALPGDYR
jgi:hypothetical protein